MLPHRPLWSITTLLTIAYRFRPDFSESLDTLLVSFNGLRSFGFSEMIKGYIFDEEVESRSIPAVIAANTGTLRTLRDLSDEVWAQLPPLSNFAHLHELEIVAIQSYDGLHALFEHCAALHAFTLLHATQELIPVLHNHPQALPDLDSFKIWGVHYTVDDTLYTLAVSSMPTTGSLSIADPNLAPGSGCAKTTETPADAFCFRGVERDDLHFGGVARLMELERWEGGRDMDGDEEEKVKDREKDEQATNSLRAQAVEHEQE